MFSVLRLIRSLREPGNRTKRLAFQRWLQDTRQYGAGDRAGLRQWQRETSLSRRDFAALLDAYLKLPFRQTRRMRENVGVRNPGVTICETCTHLDFRVNMTEVPSRIDGSTTVVVCSGCRGDHYFTCAYCGHTKPKVIAGPSGNLGLPNLPGYRLIPNNHRLYCVSCFEINFFTCRHCGRIRERGLENRDQPGYCTGCRIPERSRCEPKFLDFEFPALCTEQKVVKAEDIVNITLGGGDISESGMRAIHDLVFTRTRGNDDYGVRVRELLDENWDRTWVNKEGALPKRIAKILLVQRHMKLTDELMSEIGNIAKTYTTKPGVHRVGFTKNINRPREEFINDRSCWWTDYWRSRCSFKSLGGIGVRTFDDLDRPTGRAWMLPMKFARTDNGYGLARVAPEAIPAEGYLIFNAYSLDGSHDLMRFGRMIAQMTGKSYRKVPVHNTIGQERLYINASGDGRTSAVLIGEQSLLDQQNRPVYLGLSPTQHCGCRG